MRKTICIETTDVQHVSGQILLPGSLKWEDREYPITSTNAEINTAGAVIGKARDIRRDPDGRITAELEIFDVKRHQVLEEVGWAPTIYGSSLEAKREDGVMFVSSLVLRSIFYARDLPWFEA